jgi:hypothetical protein
MREARRARGVVTEPYARPDLRGLSRCRCGAQGFARLRRLLMPGDPPIRLRSGALGQEFTGVEVLHFNPRCRRESRDLIRIELHRPSLNGRGANPTAISGKTYQKDGSAELANRPISRELFQALDEKNDRFDLTIVEHAGITGHSRLPPLVAAHDLRRGLKDRLSEIGLVGSCPKHAFRVGP